MSVERQIQKSNIHQKGTLIKEELKGTLGKPSSSYFLSYCKKQNYNNKRDVSIFSLVFTPRITHVAEIGLWTLRPRFLSGFNPH